MSVLDDTDHRAFLARDARRALDFFDASIRCSPLRIAQLNAHALFFKCRNFFVILSAWHRAPYKKENSWLNCLHIEHYNTKRKPRGVPGLNQKERAMSVAHFQYTNTHKNVKKKTHVCIKPISPRVAFRLTRS